MKLTRAALTAAFIALAHADGAAGQSRGWSIPFYGSESQPVEADGILYVGSSRGELLAVDLASGKTRWTYQTGATLPLSAPMRINAPEPKAGFQALSRSMADPWPARRVINAAPLVDRGTVFLASEDRGFYALDAQSGVLRWRLDLPRPATGATVTAGRVVFAAANKVLAYERDGQLAWSYEFSSEVPNDVRDSPTVPVQIGELLYVAKRFLSPVRVRVVALDAQSGALKWSFDAPSSLAVEPIIANGLVFLSTTYPEGMRAIDAGTGALRWTFNAENCHANVSPAMVAGGRVLFATDCGIYGLEQETGKLAWMAPGSSTPAILRRSAAGSRLLLAPMLPDRKLHALDAVSGQALWSVSTGRVLATGDDLAYVASQNSFVAVNLQNGRTRWQLRAGAEVSSNPLLVDGKICFTSGVPYAVRFEGFVPIQGKLVCADARTGKF